MILLVSAKLGMYLSARTVVKHIYLNVPTKSPENVMHKHMLLEFLEETRYLYSTYHNPSLATDKERLKKINCHNSISLGRG